MTQHNTQIVSSSWRKGLFDKKVVFCTGGSGGICGAQVRALVYLGANACIVGRNETKAREAAASMAQERKGARVIGLGGVDVRSPEKLEKAVAICVAELGGIDFVIAGAAGNFLVSYQNLSTNAFKTVLDIDLMGSWNVSKATMPHLLKSAANAKKNDTTGGRIIFISATAQYTGTQLSTHAAVAKSGVDALAVQLAIEMGPRGITSNVIAPGPIEGTEGVRRLLKDTSRLSKIPLGRLGQLKEVADAVVYLFGDTGDYVNGSVLVVDGGSWRTGGGQVAEGFPYPEFLLSDAKVGETQTSKNGLKL